MEKDIRIDGLNIHYRESGPSDAVPVVLMHGWGCESATLASVEGILNERMRVINIDLPGHGRSDEPGEVWGVDEYTVLMEHFLKGIGVENPVMLGHSFGGRVGIIFASRNAVRKMLLVDAAGVKPRRSLKYYVKVYSFKAARHILTFLFGKKRGGCMVDKLRGNAGSADYRNSSPRMRAVMSRVVNQDLKGYMPKIKAPTLLIWGEDDTATPLTDAKIMERLIPDAGLVSFPGCGHYSFLDNPAGFRAVVKEFLKDELK